MIHPVLLGYRELGKIPPGLAMNSAGGDAA
jgi:hypothetical protein